MFWMINEGKTTGVCNDRHLRGSSLDDVTCN